MNSTIAISTSIRDELKDFGSKGETYEMIIARLLKSAKARQLQELLMDDSDCITLAEARKKLNE